jgi:hypoxanthine phosphoribosyltransferase
MVLKTPSHTSEVKIDWKLYDEDVHKLAELIKKSKEQLHCIYAVPRGGLVIAVHLSHLLGLPITDNPFGHILVVDDISDSGSTLDKWRRKRLARVSIATLYVKEGTKVVPNFWVAEYKKDQWVEFPWEV